MRGGVCVFLCVVGWGILTGGISFTVTSYNSIIIITALEK